MNVPDNTTFGNVRICMLKGEKGDGVEAMESAIETERNERVAADDALRSAIGTPLKASTAAQMTNTSKIYVYTGSESGYTAGHWYYYTGSVWADGGVYNSTAFETDKTLAVADMAADAKETGDQITDLKSALDTGYKPIDADWARGTLANGEYSGSHYKQVATQTPVTLEFGDRLSISNGYKYLLNYKYGNSFLYLGWITSDYVISVPGRYMICVTSDPEPSENITDISLYVSRLTCTSSAQRQIDIITDFIKNYVNPNLEPGKNLFNRETVKSGYLVDINYGILVENVNNSVSDFIRVYSGETIYKRNCSNWYSVLYDLNYSYVEPLTNANDVTISQDGYIRVTVPNTNLTTAIISRTSVLPDASDYKYSFIDRVARKEITEMSTWSNTIETLVSQLEIRDSSYHDAGSVDISEYAFVSIRVGNSLGVPCTMNFYDDRISTSTTWMSRPDGSYVFVNVPAGSCIITADDLKELPYFKYLRPIITPASAPESGSITIQIVGRK